METFQILVLSISVLLALSLLISVVLWCRSWRREERAEHAASLRGMAEEVSRLREAVELLDQTAASLQTVDGQIAARLEAIRSVVVRLQAAAQPQAAAPALPARVDPRPDRRNLVPDVSGAADAATPATEPRYERARTLLAQGLSEIDVAKELDMGPAEVRMISRMAPAGAEGARGRKALITRG
jgi:hypothetical protein